MDSLTLLEARGGGAGDYLADLFPKQRAFYDDPAKVKAAIAGRRGGKTWADAVGLYESARRNKRSQNPYICLSGVSARRIMWPVLEELNERYSLGMKMHAHELIAELDNGSKIFCVGGDDNRKVEALRGGKYGRAVVDEYGSFGRELGRYLIEDVLDAALLDLDGDLWLTGSPNAACVGHFHDLTTGTNPDVAKIPTYHWNVLDNPYIPHAADWLAKKRTDKKWAEDHPVYRREYLGHWVRDSSSLVFRFDRARHSIDDYPKPTRCVLGVDLGASDTEATSAFVVVGWTKHDQTTRAMYARKCSRLNPADGAEEVKRLMGRFPISYVVVDEGGLGKGYADQWRMRNQLPVRAAQKREKFAYVEFLNGELDAGRALVSADAAQLAGELDLLQWDEDRENYDDRFADHCADAWLYAWRECYAWNEVAAPNAGPQPGTPAWELAQTALRKQKAIDEAMKRAAREGRALRRRYG